MKRISLNDDWYVYPRDDAFSLVTAIPDDAVHTSVPYDALWHEGPQADSVNGGRTSYFDGQVYYYQRELVLDPAMRDMRLLLKFEAIFSKSFVYVNGSQVGCGDFGYASLTCDITSYVHWDAPNTLLVVCKTDLLSSRWYMGCGIVRPVWLMYGPLVHTEPDSIWLTTQELTPGGGARVRLRATLRNLTARAQNVDVCLRLFDDDGSDVLRETFPVRLGERYELDRYLYLRNIRPWSEDDPHWYWIELVVGEDVAHTRCGLRTESWDPERGLLINGKPVLLRGACIHHDEGILGGVAHKEFELWRVARLKEAGFNAIRSAHNHASQELLDACDKLGVYVLDEVCDMWTKPKGFGDFAQYFPRAWRDVVDNMVCEDRFHACVMGYSTGNEISDINTERGFALRHQRHQRRLCGGRGGGRHRRRPYRASARGLCDRRRQPVHGAHGYAHGRHHAASGGVARAGAPRRVGRRPGLQLHGGSLRERFRAISAAGDAGDRDQPQAGGQGLEAHRASAVSYWRVHLDGLGLRW